MLPLITAALSLLQNQGKRAEQEKQDKIAAAEGQAPAPKVGGDNGLAGIMGMLSQFKTKAPLESNGLSKGTNNMLDSEGFDGKNAPSNEDLLSDY